MQEQELLELTRALVGIPSMNPPGGEEPVCRCLEEFLAGSGVCTRRVDAEPGRPCLLAVLKGKGQAAPVIFTGHMDVVPVSEEESKRWFSDPFDAQVRDGRLWGRGSTDMKGGLAAATFALAQLARNGWAGAGDIVLAATVDEEDTMKGSRVLLGAPELAGARLVLVCEPTGLRLATASRGRTWAKIILKGRTGHGSQPVAGSNAIVIAGELMQRLKEHTFAAQKHPVYGHSFWQPLAIRAGVEPGVVPDRCELTVDARLVPGHEPEQVWEEMRLLAAELKELYPGLELDIQPVDARRPWVADPNASAVQHVRQILAERGLSIEEILFSGSTDGNIFCQAGIDPLILGPGDLNLAHRENENICLQELFLAAQIYEQLMKSL